MFYYFDELTSTVDEARSGRYVHGDVVVARHQTAGRGQRGRTWASPAGQNLMVSVVLDTSFLAVGEQFLLLQAVALALVDSLSEFGLDARVKWPNDIYIGDRKVAGVLIDHTLGPNGRLARTGVGIGLNVNQTAFDPSLPNPTSLALELGRELDLREVLELVYERIITNYELRITNLSLQDDYRSRLYRLGVPAEYETPDGQRFTGTIRGVRPSGELIVEMPDGTRREFLFREISMSRVQTSLLDLPRRRRN